MFKNLVNTPTSVNVLGNHWTIVSQDKVTANKEDALNFNCEDCDKEDCTWCEDAQDF